MKSSAPESRASTRSCTPSRPVSITIGVVMPLALMRRHTSTPLKSGKSQSRRIRSLGFSRRAIRALWPSAASRTA